MKSTIWQRKRFCSRSVLILVAASVCLSAAAEEKKSDPGLLNGWLREKSPAFDAWNFGGQGRVRYDVKENAGSFPNSDFIRRGVDNDNSYLLLREKIHAGF